MPHQGSASSSGHYGWLGFPLLPQILENGSQSNLQSYYSGTHRWGRDPDPRYVWVLGSSNEIKSSSHTEIGAKGTGSCRYCVTAGLEESEGVGESMDPQRGVFHEGRSVSQAELFPQRSVALSHVRGKICIMGAHPGEKLEQSASQNRRRSRRMAVLSNTLSLMA